MRKVPNRLYVPLIEIAVENFFRKGVPKPYILNTPDPQELRLTKSYEQGLKTSQFLYEHYKRFTDARA